MAGADYLIAFSGGVVSFLSPCVLPLVPVYLSVTTGLGVAELRERGRARTAVVLRGAGLFSLGFSVVFIALGLSVTAIGGTLMRNQVPITRVAGVVVVVMAVAMLLAASGRGGLVARDTRIRIEPARYGAWAAPLTGAAFAFGWTPCIGPVLGSILAVAAGQDALARGGALLTVYSLGLALPFLVTGLAFHRSMRALQWSRQHSLSLVRGSAVLLGAYGVLLAFDRLSWVTLQVQEAARSVGLERLVTLG
jgi:cytochrome c-type biogenesis protein